MKICARGLTTSYEIEHLARVFYKNAQITSEYSTQGDAVYARLGKAKIACAVRIGGKCIVKKARLPENSAEKPEFELARLLYTLLSEATGYVPQWGLITGVRPVRLIHDMRKKGMTDTEIKSRFLDVYKVSRQKTMLSFQIANIQAPIMATSAQRSYSLYISIPFCPSRCSYCSFVSRATAQSKALIEPYVQLLQKELYDIAGLARALNLRLETVYIGGGTPTALSEAQLAALMQTVQSCFDLSSVREYTVEAGRPDCTNSEKLNIIKHYGASRISINPQSMQDSVLRAIGRMHTAQDISNCFYEARKAGHTNINMDLIAGLPTDTVLGFENSLKEVIALSPENITVHTLTLKRASNLVIEKDSTAYADTAKMINKCTMLAENAYLPYYLYKQKNTVGGLENTGYCKDGTQGLYNIFIMEEVHSILSAGAGGSTKLVSQNGKIQRIFNHKYPIEYIKHFDTLLTRKKGVTNFYASNVDT